MNERLLGNLRLRRRANDVAAGILLRTYSETMAGDNGSGGVMSHSQDRQDIITDDVRPFGQ
jgi:hypothetical protein